MPPRAPWRTPLETHLTTNSSTTFTLSTIALSSPTHQPLPRSRTCEFRGFWPTPTLHPSTIEALQSQGIGLNPPSYISDCLSATTDARMEKVEQLKTSGGVAECVFWLADVKTQWRVRGSVWVIGDPEGGEYEEEARRRVFASSQFVGDGERDWWTVERQVAAYFANHSPVMRGTFKNPPPGQPKPNHTDDEQKLGQKVTELNDSTARANFRVMVIVPEEVESLNVKTMHRKKWTLDGDGDAQEKLWKEVELWP